MNADDKKTIRIAVSESKGAMLGGPHLLADGTVVDTIAWGSKCPGCDTIPQAGQKVTKIFYAWWHAHCGAAYLRSTGANEAWLALAHQLERAPSKFNTAEIKAIVRNLLRIAGNATEIPEHGHSDRVHGDRAVLAATPARTEPTFTDVISGYHGSDLYAAVLEVEQRNPDVLPALIGMRAWSELDADQQRDTFPELLQAFVELVQIQRDEDREGR